MGEARAGGRQRWLSGVLSVLLGAAAACDRRSGPPAAAFEVASVVPGLAAAVEGPAPLYLNQEITVRFTQPVDRLSITEDTVRVLDERGLRVPLATRSSSNTSVTIVPVAPLSPTLDDGSFKPSQHYTLEVVGFPRANAVRSVSGSVLAHTVTRQFRAVDLDAKPSPLWPSSTSPFGFALEDGALTMAADSRFLRLYFHELPLPTTVTPRAFRLCCWRPEADGGYAWFAPTRTRLRAVPRPYVRLPGWVVELELDHPPVRAGEPLFLELVADPAVALRDPSGQRPKLLVSHDDRRLELREVKGPFQVVVVQGARVPLLREEFDREVGFRAVHPAAVRFEVRDGAAVAQVRTAAGSGRLGLFAPRTSMVLEPGKPFDRGDGVIVQSDGPSFDFLGVAIPSGVTVSLRGGGEDHLQLRATGSIWIEGQLVLEGTPLGRWESGAQEVASDDLIQASGVVLLAGGDILVPGRIGHNPRGDDRSGSPLTLLCGGGMVLGGALPSGVVLATEPTGRVWGTLQGRAVRVRVAPMVAAPPEQAGLRAEAVTEWMALPTAHGPIEDVVAVGASPGLRVEVQIAPADASNPSRPAADSGLFGAPLPLPLQDPLQVPPEAFVRFFLRADLEPGAPLPSLQALAIFAG